MANLFDRRCPQCGSTDWIDVQAKVWVRLTEDGSDADESECGDHEFGPDEPALCAACGHRGTVAGFEKEVS